MTNDTTDVHAMSDTELRIALAELLGAEWWVCPKWDLLTFTDYTDSDLFVQGHSNTRIEIGGDVPDYPASHADAHALGDELARRGLTEAYTTALWEIVRPAKPQMHFCWNHHGPDGEVFPGFMMAQATPRRRAEAAYVVLREAKEM